MPVRTFFGFCILNWILKLQPWPGATRTTTVQRARTCERRSWNESAELKAKKKRNLYPAHTQIFFFCQARAASSRLRSGIDFRSSITHWEVEGITFWVLTWLFCLTHIVSGAAVRGCFHEGENPFRQDGIWRSQLSCLLTARCFESK